jgi:hypothetical protein
MRHGTLHAWAALWLTSCTLQATGGQTLQSTGGSSSGSTTTTGGSSAGTTGSTGSSGGTASGGATGGPNGPGCQADCTKKTCGSDGCGGTCGGCPPSMLCTAAQTCDTPKNPTDTTDIVIDAQSQLTPISSAIYGTGYFPTDVSLAGLNRWGGDSTGTYNWKTDDFNTGSDYWCANYSGLVSYTAAPYTKGYDRFIAYNIANHLDTLMTIPMTGWLAKDGSYNDDCCGNNCSVISSEPNLSKTCCVSGGTNGSTLVDGGSGTLDTTYMQDWVRDMVTTFGTATTGGVKYYQIDNEPDNWVNLRPDIYSSLYPPGTNCEDFSSPTLAGNTISVDQDFINRTFAYAKAVKSVDPAATVLFMSTENPTDLASLSQLYCGASTSTYSTANPVTVAILKQAAALETSTGQRVLDCVDFHYPTSASAFWTTSQPESKIQGWINANYPGTGTCVSEYVWPGDAPTQADLLGTYGRFGLRLASSWPDPNGANTSGFVPAGSAQLFRNYDKKGGKFGSVSLGAASPHPGVNVYASSDSATAPTTLWIMLVNTTGGATGSMSLALRNFTATAANTFTLTSAANAPSSATAAPLTNGGTTIANLSLAAGAVTLLVVNGALAVQ